MSNQAVSSLPQKSGTEIFDILLSKKYDIKDVRNCALIDIMNRKICSISYRVEKNKKRAKGQTVDALAQGGEEGRGKLR